MRDPKRNDTLVNNYVCRAHILILNNILQKQYPGFLGAMADNMAKEGNI